MGYRTGAHLARRRRPNLIVDDGGDATLLVHLGAQAERDGSVPELGPDDSDEFGIIAATLRKTLRSGPACGRRWRRG